MERSGISETGVASRTAMLAACARARHLFVQGPRAVLADWLAWPLVGAAAEEIVAGIRGAFGEAEPLLATWLAARSRLAEDWLAQSGAAQYAILGAGLDSFAWRQAGAIRVFEVDHPATQEWKRARLRSLGIAEPDALVWAPVDFERQSIADGLAGAGIGARSTFITWLGVIPYLSLEAIESTLADLPPCSLAVSYGVPDDTWPDAVRAVTEIFAGMAAKAGEPLRSRFAPERFAALLSKHGFTVLDDAGFEDVEPRYGLPALSIAGERVTLATKR
jgi:methyltransferase (TIGR00027 family)